MKIEGAALLTLIVFAGWLLHDKIMRTTNSPFEVFMVYAFLILLIALMFIPKRRK